MDELPSHLGGHKNKTHLDEGTIDYLIKKFKPKFNARRSIICMAGRLLLQLSKIQLFFIFFDLILHTILPVCQAIEIKVSVHHGHTDPQ